MPDLTQDPLEALKKHFSHRAFLDGQQEVVNAILSGRDAIAVMPTGGGKSLCYQLPAMVLQGVTVVVSPLIALMKDQVDALADKGIPAVMINSSLSPAEQREHINAMQNGAYKLVYVAPERFRSGAFTKALKKSNVELFAIDEAHCLSQWGHDFRPDYLLLGNAIREIGTPQIAAFTATATPEVRADILHHLALRDPFQCVSGFARPNLSLQITPCAKRNQKYKRIQAVINL
ncbi:MAG: RecQ family ATP-dependent DNA helicase, partial [Verrucomicrobiaceae bacterium]|nr:RecQ family ATP-dependent DNA helicase [Verrucomicrobiaceae bacterium]